MSSCLAFLGDPKFKKYGKINQERALRFVYEDYELTYGILLIESETMIGHTYVTLCIMYVKLYL